VKKFLQNKNRRKRNPQESWQEWVLGSPKKGFMKTGIGNLAREFLAGC
jgi:hypothetical protein